MRMLRECYEETASVEFQLQQVATIRYDVKILTCAPKLTLASLVHHTRNLKLTKERKSKNKKNQICSVDLVNG